MKSRNFFFKRLFSFFLNEKNYHKIKSLKIINDVRTKIDHDHINGLISKIIPGNSVIIDVGANMGQCTGRFSLALPDAKIYSLEPIHENYIAIKRMLKILNLKNVQVSQVGISNHEGKCEIFIPVLKGVTVSTQASLENRKIFDNKYVRVRKELIATEKLGNFIRRNNIERVDLIKVDTEGHDYTVLNSGKEEILEKRPIIKMENDWDSREIYWLYENGYQAFQIKNNKLHCPRKHLNMSGDSVLIPREILSGINEYINIH